LKKGWTICHYVWTDVTLNSLKFLDTDGRPNGIAMSSGRMLLTDERLDDLQGRPDGFLGSDFSMLESAQNLLGTFEIAFFILVTLNFS
jgi:uncharacterized ion transporter superfamily protein YfcC